mmetsp:Transcript_25966/g.72486  ORF Transcript_25966/g.72486 Transcript_25966/m.72486 type:complete len:363 (+) Transcript_25966:128-1216(+)
MPDCFEVTMIEGKGRGIVASRRIQRGEVIHREKPLIEFRLGQDLNTLEQQFYALPAAKQEAVMGLFDSGAFNSGAEKSLLGIYVTNAVLCTGSLFDSNMFETVSYFNHSCSPNVRFVWDEDAKEEVVVACVDIEAGRELCPNYVDACAPRAIRRAVLWEGYHFECSCVACDEVNVASSDARRTRLSELGELFGNGTSMPLQLTRGMFVSSVLATEALARFASETLALHADEGIATSQVAEAAVRCALHSAVVAGDGEGARRWLSEALDMWSIRYGNDHAEMRRLQAYAQDYHLCGKSSARGGGIGSAPPRTFLQSICRYTPCADGSYMVRGCMVGGASVAKWFRRASTPRNCSTGVLALPRH